MTTRIAGRPTQHLDRSEALWLALAPVVGRLTLAVLAAIWAMYLFIQLAHQVGEGETRQFDFAVLQFLREHRDPRVYSVMYWISWTGGPRVQPLCFGLCILSLALARRFWPDGLTVLLGGLGGTALMYGLKRLFQRPRPEAIFDELGYSFPSGHTFFALVLYCMLAYWLARDAPRRRKVWIWGLALTATFLMGFSRMYLGEHFPSDVAASVAIGVPWVWGCLALPAAFHRGGRDITPEEKPARYQAGAARLREAGQLLPLLAPFARALARDPRVPRSRSFALWLVAGYAALPLDLFPDFVPLLGAADDFLLAGLVLDWVGKQVPVEVVREHWKGEADLFPLLAGVRSTLTDLWKRG